MPDFSTPVRLTDEQKKHHQELFKKNHVLAPRDVNVSISSSKTLLSDTPNSSFGSDANLSIITHHQVVNDPQTPHYREEFRRRQSSLSDLEFSPAIPTTAKKILNSTPTLSTRKNSQGSLHRYAMTNTSSSSEPLDTSILKNEKPQQAPSSIMKKKINYDPETSKKIVAKIPELSSAVNSDGELNPLKASKAVTFSPRKQFMAIPKNGKYSSPLTDSINGKSSSSVRSPYIRSSKKSRTPKVEDQWIDDEGEDQHKEKRQKKKKKASPQSSMVTTLVASFFNPQMPYVLSLYLQLLFNVIIVSILLYFVYTFISTVRADVENKVDSYATDIIQEIALCLREYERNNCQPGHRVVALEAACSEWEKCMNRDPATVGRARIGAETFAEIINGFIKPISWKSMFFIMFITVGSLVLTNAAFGTYRNYSGDDRQQQQPHAPYPNPPSTPHMIQTPHQTPYRSLQMNPAYTRYYTPKASSPTSGAMVRHRLKSAKKTKK
jgi:hypothetical protein